MISLFLTKDKWDDKNATQDFRVKGNYSKIMFESGVSGNGRWTGFLRIFEGFCLDRKSILNRNNSSKVLVITIQIYVKLLFYVILFIYLAS